MNHTWSSTCFVLRDQQGEVLVAIVFQFFIIIVN
mgnify:CR=1 FL=1